MCAVGGAVTENTLAAIFTLAPDSLGWLDGPLVVQPLQCTVSEEEDVD